MDVDASAFLHVGEPRLTEFYTYEVDIAPGYFGGEFPISVSLDGEPLGTYTLSVVGPAPPSTAEAIFPASPVTEPPSVEPPAPVPPQPDGCVTGSTDGSSTVLGWLLLLGWLLRRQSQALNPR